MIDLARSVGHDFAVLGLAEAGSALRHTGHLADWEHLLHVGADLVDPGSPLHPLLLAEHGLALSTLGDPEHAMSMCRDAVDAARGFTNPQIAGVAYAAYGHTALAAAHPEQATGLLDVARGIWMSSGNRRGEAELAFDLADAHTALNRDAAGITDLISATAIAARLGDTHLHGRAATALAQRHLRLREHELALDAAAIAVHLLAPDGPTPDLAQAWTTFSAVQHDCGSPWRAAYSLDQALAVHRTLEVQAADNGPRDHVRPRPPRSHEHTGECC